MNAATLNDKILAALAAAVCQIARSAGAAILEIYNKEEGYQIEQKSDASPLTMADKAANAIICEGLEKLSPALPIISEENKAIPYEQRKYFNALWMVDPLDGTKEFIKRNGEFTVNIALIQKDAPILGVVYIPVKDELYFAIKNQGAFEVTANGNSPIQTSGFSLSDEGLRLVCSRSHLNEATEAFVAGFKNPQLIARGSSLKFLALAKGEAELYPRLAPTMEWDTAAAHIILEEAGGSVIGQESGQPLRYNKPNLLNPHFVASGRSGGHAKHI